jgi:hypothetical protein
MRIPTQVGSTRTPDDRRRRRWWIFAIIVVVIVGFASLHWLAGLFTDSLWFSSIGHHQVWSTLFEVKAGLFVVFGAFFFLLLWGNLLLCDRLGSSVPPAAGEDEFVRSYQRVVRPYAGRVSAVVAFLVALLMGQGASGEWNAWLLFSHATTFPAKDPQFGLNVGFFVFKLPLVQFIVDWLLLAVFLTFLFTVFFHYLNGGIRLQRSGLRVLPSVKIHLSILLALIAIGKAFGYLMARYQLDLSTNGYVNGAGYADVHARLPALMILFFVSLFAAAILLYNIRQQGWTLPVLAVALWAFVALVIGVIYPALLQALKVSPAQSTLEKPYIARNIKATRDAYGLNNVKESSFQDSTTLPTTLTTTTTQTLSNIRLWDPADQISLATFNKKQAISAYYDFRSVQMDRYWVTGKLQPTIEAARQISPTNLPSGGWVNQHLQYTHGNGIVLAKANSATADGNPVFTVSNVPSTSQSGYPHVTQPGVYFGLNQPGYVLVDTKQAELNEQRPTGTDVESHYKGTGGIQVGTFLRRAAFAMREGDLNLLISSLITTQSKIFFVRDVQAIAQKEAPFLSFDSQPYASVINGQVDWILNGYTTSSNYPYSQNASTQNIPEGSGLPGSYNYARDAVAVVVNAYSGKTTMYALDNDPILRAYEGAFPHLFVPFNKMPTAVRAHIRYPENLFAAQAALYGRYHITNPSGFYNAGDSWILSPTTGAGAPQNALQVTLTTNGQGQVIGGSYQPMQPLYQVLAEPGTKNQSFTITDAYVPAGGNAQVLRAFVMAKTIDGRISNLHIYKTPPGSSKVGPVQADTEIQQAATVSPVITLLNKEGSQVVLGNTLMIPVDQSVLYVRPLYVESSGNPQPQLKYVIAVFGQKVAMKPTLGAALNAVLGTSIATATGVATASSTAASTTSKKPTSSSSAGSAAQIAAQAKADLAQAASDFQTAQSDLTSGNLGGYQSEVAAAQAAAAAAQQLLSEISTSSSTSSSSSVTTTTTPSKKKKAKTTTKK